MRRQLVIGVLKDTARMLELAGESFYRVRAYNNAVIALLKLDADFEELVQQDRLREIPGVGAGIEQSIREILDTGTTTVYVELAQEIPPTLLDLYNIPGLGTKRIRYLYDTLQITNLGELEYACQENRLLTLKGFGPKSQADILAGIKTLRRYQQSTVPSRLRCSSPIEDVARRNYRRKGPCQWRAAPGLGSGRQDRTSRCRHFPRGLT